MKGKEFQLILTNELQKYPATLSKLLFFLIQIKRRLQQIALNHSSGIVYKDFINIYKLASDNPLHFRKILLEEILKLIKEN